MDFKKIVARIVSAEEYAKYSIRQDNSFPKSPDKARLEREEYGLIEKTLMYLDFRGLVDDLTQQQKLRLRSIYAPPRETFYDGKRRSQPLTAEGAVLVIKNAQKYGTLTLEFKPGDTMPGTKDDSNRYIFKITESGIVCTRLYLGRMDIDLPITLEKTVSNTILRMHAVKTPTSTISN